MPEKYESSDLLSVLLERLDRIHEALTKPDDKAELLGRTEAAAILGMGQSTFDKAVAAGRIGPKAIDLAGPKWHRSEVELWLSVRDNRGELYDAQTWPAIAAQLRQQAAKRK